MDRKVLKFGGTSMGDEQTWRIVMDIIASYDAPVVVVSATARTTRKLIAAAESALKDLPEALRISSEIRSRHEQIVTQFLAQFDHPEIASAKDRCMQQIEDLLSGLDRYLTGINRRSRLDPSIKDAVASIGEQLSSALFAECGKIYGLDMFPVNAGKVIKTDSDHGNATPLMDKIEENIHYLTDENGIPVIGGYFGEDENGAITTLGFEGSDYTASIIGAIMNASSIEIWTDVSGIYTCDPKVVEEAVSIPEISFREATEMAYFGAKVLHPSTLKPASEKNIPVYVKNIFDPDHPGTKITDTAEAKGLLRAITFLEKIVVITITSPATLMGYHFLSRVFKVLEAHHITVDVVTTTEASVSIALEHSEKTDPLIHDLERAGEVSVTEKRGLISLIGCNISRPDKISSHIFSSLKDEHISMISYSRDKNNLNLVLPEEHVVESVRAIHKSFFG